MEINSLTTKWKKMKPITKHIQEDSDDEDYSKIGDNLEDESNNNSERNLGINILIICRIWEKIKSNCSKLQ